MRDPISDQLAVLGTDADRVVLADPADLRRAGTHRNRIRLAVTALAVLAVIGGTALAFQPSAQTPPVPTTSPSPKPSPEPSSEQPPEPPVGSAPEDQCYARLTACFPPEVNYLDELLPAPCTTMDHPSEAKLVTRTPSRGVSTLYVPSPPSNSETSRTDATYSSGGASMYLAEVRSAVARCPSVQRAASRTDPTPVTLRYRQVSTADSPGADETVLLSRTYPTARGEQTFLISVQRRGDKVRVVIDYGWQGLPSTRNEFDLARSPVLHPWD
ncbi:hypothetical protein AB0K00_15875 [Dactylosporangium sp. NPDC049525]|uniref:hypothetical protein n=1 Tax=Dactylosporangium sp. NPDC049525 TaxID=3154730 RepID=UPI00341D34CB